MDIGWGECYIYIFFLSVHKRKDILISKNKGYNLFHVKEALYGMNLIL